MGSTKTVKAWITIAVITTLLCSSLIRPGMTFSAEVDPELIERFNSNESTGYVLHFGSKPSLTGLPQTGWKEQNEFINKALQENADRSQARVRSYLFSRRVSYRSLWRDNTIVVDTSDRDTFEGLLSFPEIETITALKASPETPPVDRPAR